MDLTARCCFVDCAMFGPETCDYAATSIKLTLHGFEVSNNMRSAKVATDIRNFFNGSKKCLDAKKRSASEMEAGTSKKFKGRLRRAENHRDNDVDEDASGLEEDKGEEEEAGFQDGATSDEVSSSMKDEAEVDFENDAGNDEVSASVKEEKESSQSGDVKGEASATVREQENWNGGVPYSAFARVCGVVEKMTGRLQITEVLSKFIAAVLDRMPADLLPVLYLLSNQVAPAYENVELGVGDALLQKAIAQACGKNERQIKAESADLGDLGLAAEKAREKQKTLSFALKPKALTVARVLREFREVATISGSKSQDIKVGKMCKLFTAATPVEVRYLVRALSGNMRIHSGRQTVLTALAHAAIKTQTIKAQTLASVSRERAEEIVKTCYSVHPVLDTLVKAVQAGVPIEQWPAHCSLTVGVPVKPMCAKAEKAVSAVLKRLSKVSFVCEHKYDGERLQAHYDGDTFRLFSRNCAETTHKWPDVVSNLRKVARRTNSFILDAEVVAVDPRSRHFAPFQVLSTRKKKDVEQDQIEVPVVVMVFDLLLLNGESLLKLPFRERRRRLDQTLDFDDVVKRADYVDCDKDADDDERAETIGRAMEVAISLKVEGLMIKTLDSNATYEPQKRSLNWLKLKKDYLDQFMADSFDLVVVGGYRGKGKRTGTFGSYLLACYDQDDATFQTVCKVATGFSEGDLQQLDDHFKAKLLDARPRHVLAGDSLQQDVQWIVPSVVFEIRAADLSLSSTHKGALGKLEPGRGIGLRFPRFERMRDDKDADQATTAEQVLDAYLEQDAIKNSEPSNNHAGADSDDDGFL